MRLNIAEYSPATDATAATSEYERGGVGLAPRRPAIASGFTPASGGPALAALRLRRKSWRISAPRAVDDPLCAAGGQLGEGVPDLVEVGSVGRVVKERRSRRFDRLAQARVIVAAGMVHDGDLAGRRSGTRT